MNKWIFWLFCRHISIMNRKLPLLGILITLFLIAAFLQQNRIQEYSHYNWLQTGNRELLSLHNSISNYRPNPNSTHFDSKINASNNRIKVRDNRVTNEESFGANSCQPKYNIVFLKTHKCASTTIQNIFMRNGFTNNKVFVLPATANYLGHPMPFNRNLVPDPKTFNHEYNILTHHSRLNYESMRSLMSNGTLFITIVRNPVQLFESMFHYYRLDHFWNITFDVFADQNTVIPDRVHTNRYVGKIGINQMMFDLGMNITDFTKPYTINKYISHLDSIFDLVMVSERMDESLVLLKHLLCWTTDDIIAFKLNARHNTAKTDLTEMAGFRIRDLNWADFQLYKHFSQKFSLLVKAFGNENMRREVNELKNRTNEWYDYCVGNENTKSVNQTKKQMIIRLKNRHSDNSTCWLLTAQEMDFTKFLRMRQMKAYPGSVFRDTKSLLRERLRVIEERRKQYLKSKFLLYPKKYRGIAYKQSSNGLLSEMTTTINPFEQLVNALKDFTFKTPNAGTHRT